MARTFLHPNEALELVLTNSEDYGNEKISVLDSYNRVLADDVYALNDDPPFNKSSMDGYAYKKEDENKNSYVLIEDKIIYAGLCNKIEVKSGECVKIMTGAMLPENCDAVQRVEWVEEVKENSKTVINFTKKEITNNVIKKGNNKKSGDKVLDKKILLPKDVAILAGFGYSNIEVKNKINTAVISTGNEIANIGESLKEGQIYDANAPMLAAITSSLSCNTKFYGKVNDDEKEIREILSKALDENDIVLISGGVSMGDFDYVHKELLDLGVNQIFHGIAMKPGKPLFFGKLGKKAVFALPGNTVSAFMTFEIMVKPYIFSCLGINYDTNYIKALITEDFKRKDAERLEYVPVRLFFDDTKLLVKLIKYNNSSMISSFSEANGILKIDIGISDIVKGSMVDVRFL
ncbi:molybdenum cofactor synthesis domain-containing protein [Brachyspira hampsonii 30446]|uniref:Molybdopterin molybdenumtransferase n=2 Tax=Brachyspira hampsonii TaxID=1287055 RepID=A0A2U4F5L1_9SPIR|nr:molybdopterin molybdotransferase MoeA [Brachyspira hampsonii]EKV56260.1 molybdenum cofactor synthesis domain-containing protein [Brachyspira hampsonii 30446]MBW5393790.1 molybdopterin molybdotransferase MoeA [Brachyspira hampsonii]OEJ17147.1 molybdopterin molybdenumtransferase MoeA [Brachyspira hampsonii]